MIGALLFTLLSCTPTATPATVDYLVRVGDTLSHVAVRFAVPGGWEALAELNGLHDPHALSPEQILQVPVAHLVARGEDPAARQPPPPVLDPAPPERACAVSTAAISLRADGCLPLEEGFLCTDPERPTREATLPPGRTLLADDPEAGLSALTVHQVDLDGDGRSEVVTQRYTGTSNGIALVYHDIEVVGDAGAPRSVVSAHQVSFAGTRSGGGCELLVHHFEYARDLRSGARHAYNLEYPMAWDGAALIALPGAWFSRMFGDAGRSFRLRTPRGQPERQDLQRRGTIVSAADGGDGFVVRVSVPGGEEDVPLSWQAVVGVGDEPAAVPVSARVGWDALVGQSLSCSASRSVCWVSPSGEGQVP